MPTTAGDVVTSVRGLVPDPVYLPLTGPTAIPQPDADGGITRASLLSQWPNGAVRRLVAPSQWFIEEWFARQLILNQPFYAVDEKWTRVTEVFVNQWPLGMVNEGDTVSPTRAMSQQPIWATHHRRTSQLEIGGYPVINRSDPTSTLTAPLVAATTSSASITNTANFLQGGGASGA